MRWAALGGAIAAGAAAGSYAVRGKSSQIFAPSIYKGPSTIPAVALTFDDGPSEGTPALLNVLARLNAPATFFTCGANVRRLPGVAREIRAAGHAIGNHSDTHPYFAFRAASFIEDEFRRAQQTIEQELATSPVYLRAPYGIRWPGFRSMQKTLGLKGVMWSILARDWKLPPDQIVSRVLSRIHNGAILCLHDGRALQERPDISATVAAVGRLIPELRARGYTLTTLPELLCPTN